MVYEIIYSPETIAHLQALSKSKQTLVLDQVDVQLQHEPQAPSRKRKVLRPNPIAPWELRLGEIRVFYEVQDEPAPRVVVKAIGFKRHNELWIGQERIEL